MEETLKIIHTREVAEATFYSTFNNLLEQAKNNPDMLLNIPYENILNLEKNLEEMTKRHEAGSINSEYEINLLKEFLTFYKKTKLKHDQFDHVFLNIIKKRKKINIPKDKKTRKIFSRAYFISLIEYIKYLFRKLFRKDNILEQK